MPVGSGIRLLVWLVTMFIGSAVAFGVYSMMGGGIAGGFAAAAVEFITLLVAYVLASAVRLVNQWQRAIVLHLGRFSAVRGPGLFFITPILQTVAYVIDLRTIATSFR